MKKQEEEFRDIPGFDGYQVSNLGRVKSLARVVKRGTNHFSVKEKILSQNTSVKGYYRLSLNIDNKRKSIEIHTLIALSFFNHKYEKSNNLVVDHIDNNKKNNRLENLQLISHRLNSSKDRKRTYSKHIGVCFCKRTKMWVSGIFIDKKRINLGRFKTEEEANESYKKALNSVNNNEEIIIKNRVFSSAYKGVFWDKSSKKWVSAIYISKKRKHLGYFNTELEAHQAYQNKLSEINSKLN